MTMKNRVRIVFLICIGILLGVSLFLQVRKDKESPKLTCDSRELHYNNRLEVKSLLQGVKAYDETDGDLTDRIFVKNIYETEDGKGIVIYAVLDKSNNIATLRRDFIYDSEPGTMDTRVYKEEDN